MSNLYQSGAKKGKKAQKGKLCLRNYAKHPSNWLKFGKSGLPDFR